MKGIGVQRIMTGKAGEYAVASKLLMLGVPVMFPAVDLGMDLISDVGCRIQVKSAHLSRVKSESRGYCFPLLNPRNKYSDVCDVLVFWGIEENRFWVVPVSLAEKSTGLVLGGPDPSRFVGDVANMREMKTLGYSLHEIASKYGIHATSVKQFLATGKDFQSPSITSQVRKFEGAWEVISDFKPTQSVIITDLEVENAK